MTLVPILDPTGTWRAGYYCDGQPVYLAGPFADRRWATVWCSLVERQYET